MNDDAILSELLEGCRQDHQAWINGDRSRYELPEDGTIFGALGGCSHGVWSADGTSASQRRSARWTVPGVESTGTPTLSSIAKGSPRSPACSCR